MALQSLHFNLQVNMTQQSKPGKAESFEKNLERLDAVVHQLEDADLPLERALQLYE